MDKREKMLNHIQNNAGWLMSTNTFEVISYTELTRDIFYTVRNTFAQDVEYDDVVCFISTAITEKRKGRCGVLFTTKAVYTKAWGGVTSSYRCELWEGYLAEFSNRYNEFYVDRMQELINDLSEMEDDEPAPSLLNIVGNAIGTFVEEYVKSKHNEYEKLMEEAEDEALELLEDFRDTLVAVRDEIVVCWIENYDDIETYEEVVERIQYIAASSYLFVNNGESYKKIRDIDEEDTEEIENTQKFLEMINLLVERFDDIFDDEVDEDVESLKRTFKRFNSSMIRIYEELRIDEEDDDVEEIDYESYYERTQKAIKTLKKKLNNLINFLNGEIDGAYED